LALIADLLGIVATYATCLISGVIWESIWPNQGHFWFCTIWFSLSGWIAHYYRSGSEFHNDRYYLSNDAKAASLWPIAGLTGVLGLLAACVDWGGFGLIYAVLVFIFYMMGVVAIDASLP
jgi:uncharacterized membrane protein